jgi:hypothetical protein
MWGHAGQGDARKVKGGREKHALADEGQSEVDFVRHIRHSWNDEFLKAGSCVWAFGPGEMLTLCCSSSTFSQN